MASIHQLVAGLARGDAISNEARVLQSVFQSWGFDARIYADAARILPEYRKETGDAAQLHSDINDDDIVLLHLSIGSVVNDIFERLTCRKALLYHNITPPHFFELINRQTASHLQRGRLQLAQLKDACALNLADSQFNANELSALGYADPKVFPLVLDFSMLRSEPDPKVTHLLNDGKKNIVFVGRCAPNKCVDDLIQAFNVFHHCVEPNSRFIHVGSYAGTERYYHLLQSYVRESGLSDAVEFTGSVTQSQLNAYYQSADVFLCMSEHEGYCIPVIEAMLNQTPVMAYAEAAVPETMGGAGVLFREKDFVSIAEMLGRLCHDTTLRAAVIQGQQERLSRLETRDLATELKTHFAPLLGTLT
ncbi:MAG: glycosyltransferase [Kiritimatiellae bacterium]|nr:glycosyltransferase [Kiritimatiellia bacterium]